MNRPSAHLPLYRLLPTVIALLLVLLINSGRASRITIKDNGYDNILVAISPSVPANQSDIIIQNIKRMISEASPVLYKATYDRAYFRTVRILVPDSWTHVEANASSWETLEKADVIVQDANPAHGDTPYTRQLGGCGDVGEFIHLTPGYVSTINEVGNQKNFGKPGKVFVHEWAHLRYGVFDEYGGTGESNHPIFYRPPGSNIIVPNVCFDKNPSFTTYEIDTDGQRVPCKINPATNLYDETCRFEFDENFKPTTSLSSIHQIESVELFCQDDQVGTHRYDAPNRHNDLCGRKSVMAVILASPDFANDTNKPFDLVELDMDFQIVRNQEGGSRFVLVADVSGSMALCNRIDKLGESVRSWIKNDLPVGSQLGIVQFSSRAHILSEITPITDDPTSREGLMNKLPKELFSATCIGCGLDLAAQMLAEGEKKGGIILLVTDGKNSPGYHDISDVLPAILESGIRVITIAFGPEADKNIENLADLTDGKSYFVKDEDTSEAIREAFLCSLTYQSTISSSDVHVKLYDMMVKTDSGLTITGQFKVDFTVGRNLKLTIFNLEDVDNVVSMELKGPDGIMYGGQMAFDGTTASISTELAQPGKWSFNIYLDNPQTNSLQVTVTAQLLPDTLAPFTTKCWVHNGAAISDASKNPIRIHAQVWKGSNPVIGANVKAYIEKPNDEIEILDLFDNGVNADTTSNDGVYSRFFANASQEGRYSLKCQIWDDGSAYVGLGFIGSASSTFAHTPGVHLGLPKNERVLVGNLSRISSGGSFMINTPVSRIDAYPPGHVTDLRVHVVNSNEAQNITIMLKWTAPGDELDSGIVSRYELKYSGEAANLLDGNFEHHLTLITEDTVLDGSLTPVEAGLTQELTLLFPDSSIIRDRPFYLALRAVDKADKTSQVSNLASFFIPEDEMFEEASDGDDRDHQVSVIAIAISAVLIALVMAGIAFIVIHKIRRSGPYRVVPA